MRPVLLSLVRDGETVTAHLVSDLLTPLSGRITWTLATLDGETLSEETAKWASTRTLRPKSASFSLAAATAGSARFTFTPGSPRTTARTAENFLLLAEPKDLQTANPGLTLTVAEDEDGF